MRVEKIIERCGGARALAEELGLSVQAVQKWARDGYIPLMRMRDVARVAEIKLSDLPIPESPK